MRHRRRTPLPASSSALEVGPFRSCRERRRARVQTIAMSMTSTHPAQRGLKRAIRVPQDGVPHPDPPLPELTQRHEGRWRGPGVGYLSHPNPSYVDPSDARIELARRHLHIFGPTTPRAFAEWAGIRPRRAVAAFEALSKSLTSVRTPVGDAWILTGDEPAFRTAPRSLAPARLLPSGDAFFLLQGAEASSWSLTPIIVHCSGPREYGPEPSLSRARS